MGREKGEGGVGGPCRTSSSASRSPGIIRFGPDCGGGAVVEIEREREREGVPR